MTPQEAAAIALAEHNSPGITEVWADLNERVKNGFREQARIALTAATERQCLGSVRRYTAWHLGDRLWANQIIEAWLHPEETNRQLDEEQER